MSGVRIIARLDIKGPNLIKGIHLEGLRVIGDPQEFSTFYYKSGIDELIYMDSVASLYGRNNLREIVKHTSKNVFIPLTVGGGVRSVDDVRELLLVGADKVAINTAAVNRPQLISEVSSMFGSQCMVLSIEAKKTEDGSWKVYTENGREPTGLDVITWAKEGERLGAGEILLTSIDQEGTRQGFDVDLVRAVTQSVYIPVIASGGMGTLDHLNEVVTVGRADAVAIADMLHYKRYSIEQIKQYAFENDIPVRRELCGYAKSYSN